MNNVQWSHNCWSCVIISMTDKHEAKLTLSKANNIIYYPSQTQLSLSSLSQCIDCLFCLFSGHFIFLGRTIIWFDLNMFIYSRCTKHYGYISSVNERDAYSKSWFSKNSGLHTKNKGTGWKHAMMICEWDVDAADIKTSMRWDDDGMRPWILVFMLVKGNALVYKLSHTKFWKWE